MCLIIAKPKGSTWPKRDIGELFNKFASDNPCGWGIMLKRQGVRKVEIAKGIFFTSNDHLKDTGWHVASPQQLSDKIRDLGLTMKDEFAVHFRMATSGRRTNENCHPFYISRREVDLNKTHGDSPIAAVMHNGVFTAFSSDGLPESDTYNFTKYFLAEKGVLRLMYKTGREIQGAVVGGRLCILHPDKDMLLHGYGWCQAFNDKMWFTSMSSANQYDNALRVVGSGNLINALTSVI